MTKEVNMKRMWLKTQAETKTRNEFLQWAESISEESYRNTFNITE